MAEKLIRGGEIVFTLNVAHMRTLASEGAFRAAYAAATLVTLDSRFFKRWILQKHDLTVVAGSDLVAYLAEHGRLAHKKIYYLGNIDVVTLEEVFPGTILKSRSPSFGFIDKREERDDLSRDIISFDPDLVLAAVGSPQSELFVKQLLTDGLPKKSSVLCCGAAVEFLSGQQHRAPAVLQHLGVEWLWRLMKSPKRLARRYWSDLLFCLSNARAIGRRPPGKLQFASFSVKL